MKMGMGFLGWSFAWLLFFIGRGPGLALLPVVGDVLYADRGQGPLETVPLILYSMTGTRGQCRPCAQLELYFYPLTGLCAANGLAEVVSSLIIGRNAKATFARFHLSI
jgi:hypothetical protein